MYVYAMLSDHIDCCYCSEGCFECTYWSEMIDSSTNIDQPTNVITSYIRFCEAYIVSWKTIKNFPYDKPWITKRI